MRKKLAAFLIVRGILAASLLTMAQGSRKTLDISEIVGDWTGESICAGDNPSCHDERVVYHFSLIPGDGDKLRLAADKIVDGKPELMYVQDFKYDKERGTLTGEFQNARYHGLWEYTVKGNIMEGTLVLLPARTLGRRIKVRKVE